MSVHTATNGAGCLANGRTAPFSSSRHLAVRPFSVGGGWMRHQPAPSFAQHLKPAADPYAPAMAPETRHGASSFACYATPDSAAAQAATQGVAAAPEAPKAAKKPNPPVKAPKPPQEPDSRPDLPPNPLEAARPFRRTVFGFEQWRRHRSTGRWWRHMKSLPRSGVARSLAKPTAVTVSIAVIVGLWHTLKADGTLPDVIPDLPSPSTGPFGLTAFALSLLLVFRTNSSYGRWDEARKMWGKVVNRSRDITRQAVSYMQPEDAAEFGKWMRMFTRAMMCHLRDDRPMELECKGRLSPRETELLLASKHRPNFCLQMMSEVAQKSARQGDLSMMQQQAIDLNLGDFSDQIGGCERILKTPVPLFYTHHISRFMVVWMCLLPLGLWKDLQWDTPLVMALVSFLLIGIDEIGVQIEEPFGILPLEAICNTIEGNVLELVASTQATAAAIEAVQGSTDAGVVLQPASAAVAVAKPKSALESEAEDPMPAASGPYSPWPRVRIGKDNPELPEPVPPVMGAVAEHGPAKAGPASDWPSVNDTGTEGTPEEQSEPSPTRLGPASFWPRVAAPEEQKPPADPSPAAKDASISMLAAVLDRIPSPLRVFKDGPDDLAPATESPQNGLEAAEREKPAAVTKDAQEGETSGWVQAEAELTPVQDDAAAAPPSPTRAPAPLQAVPPTDPTSTSKRCSLTEYWTIDG